VAGAGLLAGCTESLPAGSDGSGDSGGDGGSTPTTAPYEVTMEPAGTVEFESVPERFLVYNGDYADIVTSLGRFDGLEGMISPGSNFPAEYFERLGLSYDPDELTNLFPGGADSADKELFYELDPDATFIDPYAARDYLGLSEDDLAELEENVSPFLGSYLRRPQYTDDHPYYSLYEGTRKIATALDELERFEELKSFHDGVREEIRSRLPDPEDRPTYAYMNMNWWEDFSSVYARQTRLPGSQYKPFRDLDVREENNAFQGQFGGERSITTDIEGLVEADPEVIIWHGGVSLVGGYSPEWYDDTMTWEEGVVDRLQEDDVASEVTAVAEGRILPGNLVLPGPTSNLFNLEDMAKQLYPEEFGEYRHGEYDTEEQLFDRDELASIVDGAV
jgi:iron complex transport system substrate-binding protein